MEINTHQNKNEQIAEIISEEIIISNLENGLDLLGNLYYQGFDKIIIYEKNLTSAFFDLKTGLAGELLQKFSTYKMQLAIIGSFSKYQSKSLNDFIFESNKLGKIQFVGNLDQALI